MSQDFIRYYIGYMLLNTFEDVQRESGRLKEWELSQGSDFNLKESYGYYTAMWKQDTLMLEAIAQRSIIAETRQPDSVRPSLFWHAASSIADVITLLSLASARYYSAFAIEEKIRENYSVSWGLIPRAVAGNWDIVTVGNQGKFISEALTFIEKDPNWLEGSGFVPSIYWFTQAQISFSTAPSVLEIGLYWVTLEVLAGTYMDANGLGITNKKDRVKRFVSDKGYSGGAWSFLDELIDAWYEVRNNLFHEGKEKQSIALLSTRRQQIRDFASLVLVEMLQDQEEDRRKEIAKRIRNY